MITLDFWHLGTLAAVFITALFHMYWTGFKRGVIKTAELYSDDGLNRALTFLAKQGIIRIEVEDGEQIIYPGSSLTDEDEQ